MRLQNLMIEANVLVIPCEPVGEIRKRFFHFVESPKFDNAVIGLIILNTIALCMEVSNASDNYKKCLEISNYIFVVLFAIEAVLKLIGLGPSFYFKNTQNQFDFVIVILSMLGLQEGLFAVNFTAFRIVRVARLLRMLKTSREL